MVHRGCSICHLTRSIWRSWAFERLPCWQFLAVQGRKSTVKDTSQTQECGVFLVEGARELDGR